MTGVAPNKLLAKLISGLHKPNDQTVLFPDQAAAFVGKASAPSSFKCPPHPTPHAATPGRSSHGRKPPGCAAPVQMGQPGSPHQLKERDPLGRRAAPLPVRALPGVGFRTEQQLVELGAATVGELRGLSRATLAQALGERVGAASRARAGQGQLWRA